MSSTIFALSCALRPRVPKVLDSELHHASAPQPAGRGAGAGLGRATAARHPGCVPLRGVIVKHAVPGVTGQPCCGWRGDLRRAPPRRVGTCRCCATTAVPKLRVQSMPPPSMPPCSLRAPVLLAGAGRLRGLPRRKLQVGGGPGAVWKVRGLLQKDVHGQATRGVLQQVQARVQPLRGRQLPNRERATSWRRLGGSAAPLFAVDGCAAGQSAPFCFCVRSHS